MNKLLLDISEDKHDDKREALAVFNNKVNKLHAQFVNQNQKLKLLRDQSPAEEI